MEKSNVHQLISTTRTFNQQIWLQKRQEKSLPVSLPTLLPSTIMLVQALKFPRECPDDMRNTSKTQASTLHNCQGQLRVGLLHYSGSVNLKAAVSCMFLPSTARSTGFGLLSLQSDESDNSSHLHDNLAEGDRWCSTMELCLGTLC